MSEFTHFDAAGNALMVDVSDKADTARVLVLRLLGFSQTTQLSMRLLTSFWKP